MFNNQEVIKRIRQNLYNISSNLHAESYHMQAKNKKPKINGRNRITSYTPSQDATEAQEIYKLSLRAEEWNRETEETIKAYILRIRVYNNNLLMDNNEYWKEIINKRAV
jgi:hypothetical protein